MKTKGELAFEVLNLSKDNIVLKMPFLTKALFSFDFKEANDLMFGSDGISIFYNGNYILNEYKDDDEYFKRALLHLLLHFLYHHNIVDDVDYGLWNLATDIAVENTINNLNLDFKNKYQDKQNEIINNLNNNLNNLNAENIYKYYKKINLSKEEINQLRFYFFYDEHPWFSGNKDNRDIKKWDDIAKEVEVDLNTYHLNSQNYLAQSLSDINRQKMTLKYFLKRFGKQEEIIKPSLLEIDIPLYTYGLNLYKNIPIIENQEFKEDKQLNDLVIAIDTSGSVKGELVKKFVEYAYSLLSDKDCLSKDLNLYIIQCDDKIEDVVNIKNKDDIDNYLNNLELKGFGQTDFRPVFEYMNDLLFTHKIKEFKGLIYFTDGLGIFPQTKPKYPCAFVIHQKQYEYIKVPTWAMKIEILEDDILDEKFD